MTVETYDGDMIEAYAYYYGRGDGQDRPPSKRYMNLIIKGERDKFVISLRSKTNKLQFSGALKAGMKKHFIDWLRRHETYSPPKWVKAAREDWPRPEELREVSYEELMENSRKDKW